MMRLAGQYLNQPVLSLHAGQAIANISDIVINPHDLSIAAFGCLPLRQPKRLFLLPQSVRESSRDGLVVNHEEDLSEAEDLLRLQDVLKMNFRLEGKPVITESKRRLGKVADYVVDNVGWQVVKLHVQRPFWRAVFGGMLIIDRSFIVSVSQRAIVVKDASVKAAEPVRAAVPTPAA
jgi:uncharacterized protein YrrD